MYYYLFYLLHQEDKIILTVLLYMRNYYKYEEFEIIKHIRLMAVLEKCTSIKRLYSEIKFATKVIDNNESFAVHQGFLNV